MLRHYEGAARAGGTMGVKEAPSLTGLSHLPSSTVGGGRISRSPSPKLRGGGRPEPDVDNLRVTGAGAFGRAAQEPRHLDMAPAIRSTSGRSPVLLARLSSLDPPKAVGGENYSRRSAEARAASSTLEFRICSDRYAPIQFSRSSRCRQVRSTISCKTATRSVSQASSRSEIL